MARSPDPPLTTRYGFTSVMTERGETMPGDVVTDATPTVILDSSRGQRDRDAGRGARR